MKVTKFIKNNFWFIIGVLCLFILGIVVGGIIRGALEVIAYYVTHALIAD